MVDVSSVSAVLLTCCLTLVSVVHSRVVVLCPRRTFYDKIKEKCMNCSSCPLNQIITSPCRGVQDTQCGPIKDLQELYQQAAQSGDQFIARLANNSTEDFTDILQAYQAPRDPNNSGDSVNTPEPEFLVTDWKYVTLLIGVAVGFVLLVLVVGIICVRQKLLRLKNSANYKLAPPVDI